MVLAFFAEAVRAHNNTISNESNKLKQIVINATKIIKSKEKRSTKYFFFGVISSLV